MATRDEIINVAVRLFSEQGFDQTTIRDISQCAEVNVAAVNYHFKNKSGLGDAVVDLLFENSDGSFNSQEIECKITNEDEWRIAIYNFIYNFIADRDKEEYRNFHRSQLIFRELNNPSEMFDKMYSKYMKPLQERLVTFLRLGLPKDASEEEVSMWFITVMSQCVMFRKKQVPMESLKSLDFNKASNVKIVAEHIANTIYGSLNFRSE